jgi:hypothetical protein
VVREGEEVGEMERVGVVEGVGVPEAVSVAVAVAEALEVAEAVGEEVLERAPEREVVEEAEGEGVAEGEGWEERVAVIESVGWEGEGGGEGLGAVIFALGVSLRETPRGEEENVALVEGLALKERLRELLWEVLGERAGVPEAAALGDWLGEGRGEALKDGEALEVLLVRGEEEVRGLRDRVPTKRVGRLCEVREAEGVSMGEDEALGEGESEGLALAEALMDTLRVLKEGLGDGEVEAERVGGGDVRGVEDAEGEAVPPPCWPLLLPAALPGSLGVVEVEAVGVARWGEGVRESVGL